jgi:hypothetical protein
MDLILFVCRSAIRCASLVAPRALRREWRDEWLAEVGYGYTHLAMRGGPRGETRRKLIRFSTGAFRDAADLYCRRFDFRSFLGHPSLCVVGPLALLGALFAFSDGFQNCREALAGLPWRRPDELVLLSRSARVLGIEAVPAGADYVDWQRRLGVPMAGFVIDKAVLLVTPDFFGVVGTSPRVPFSFLGHRIRVVRTLEQPTGRIGILARLNAANDAKGTQRILTAMSPGNGSAIGVRFVQSRTRESLIFSAFAFVLVLGIGIILALRQPGSIRFFALKAGLLEAVVAVTWAEVLTGLPISPTGGYGAVMAFLSHGLLLAASGVLLWACLRDHQRRCPVCSHLLAVPVRIGSRGSVVFAHLGEEVLCVHGHGSLYIAEQPFEGTESATWIAFGDSWKDCFASGGSK